MFSFILKINHHLSPVLLHTDSSFSWITRKCLMGYREFVNAIMNCCRKMPSVVTFVTLKKFVCLLHVSHRKYFLQYRLMLLLWLTVCVVGIVRNADGWHAVSLLYSCVVTTVLKSFKGTCESSYECVMLLIGIFFRYWAAPPSPVPEFSLAQLQTVQWHSVVRMEPRAHPVGEGAAGLQPLKTHKTEIWKTDFVDNTISGV